MKSTSEPVSLRLSTAVLAQIDARRAPFGISRGDWVRGLVMQTINGGDSAAVSAQLDGLATAVQDIQEAFDGGRKDLARLLFLLLTELGDMGGDDAKQLVVSRFLTSKRESE
jgi:hypothetical protein